MHFTLSTKWERYWVVYTQTSTTAVKHVICPRLISGEGTGTVSIKMVKFEEGNVPTPWCSNSADTNYVGSTLGFNELGSVPRVANAGYVEAQDFIEW